MARLPFYRNIRARDQVDLFLISAITSLLGVRFYLKLTNYPQVGGGDLHIAHMLYGGLLMMLAIIVSLSFLGLKAQQFCALIGGIGFGIFIDELGKFITKDNNYFFQPTIGIIYAIFVVLYLCLNFLTRNRPLSSREYQLNALAQFEEAIAFDMDPGERRQVYELVQKADPKSKITQGLLQFLHNVETQKPDKKNKISLLFKKIDEYYARFWQLKRSNFIVQGVFTAQALAIFLTALFTVLATINDVSLLFDDVVSYGDELVVGQFISSLIAISFVLYGLARLTTSRLHAFEQFRRASLVTIYLTEFFIFSRLQFDALPGLMINILFLIIISFVIREERRLQTI
jgi:hypothetical protein